MAAAHLGTWDIDLITGKAIWSELHFTLLGYESSPTGEATETMWMSRIHPDDRHQVIQEWQQSRQERRLYNSEYRAIRADNQQVVWIAALGSFTYNQHGEAVRSIGVVFDISDRKRQEHNAKFLAEISKDLAGGMSISEMLAIVGHKMCVYFGFSLLKFTEINDTTDTGQVIYANHNREEENSEYRLADDLSNSQLEHLQAGGVVAINDILIAPCIREGRLKLVVIGHRQTTSNWRSDEIELIQELATRICIQIENARTAENLRRSEAEFRTIANAAPALVWVCSPNGEVIFFNDRWYDFTRQTKAQAIGQGWSYTMHPDDAARILPEWENCQKTGAIYEGEVRYRRHDGEYRWHAFRALPRCDANGQIEAWYGLSIDITERIQAETALKESEARYRYLVEAIPQMVWTTDAQGQNNYVNQQMCDYIGLSYDELLGLNWRTVIHPDDLERVYQRWMESVQNCIPYEAEYRLRRADGAYRWHLVRAMPFQDEQGQIMQWFGVLTDIHDKQELAKQRALLLQQEQAAREKAERANRIKDEFLAVLSHELRSPLNPILGWSQLLQTQKFNPETAAKGLATIERNAKLQVQLIEDLLDVSRILRGKVVLSHHPVDLVTTIEAALETVRLAATGKNIQIQTQLDSGTVSGDSTRLQQIIWNLLTNAVKFTPQGGQVEVRLVCVDGFAQIQVQDTGKGISPEFLPYVFDYFRQEDGSTTRKFGGLGLGLAIVRYLVELHGGTVRADSPGENLGATFTVQLPLMPTQPSVNSNCPLPEIGFNLSGIQVLVVDDETDTRSLIAFLLQQAGANVIAVASAVEAFTILRRRPADVLISDIGMPDIDGYMLLRQIRALPPEQGGKIKAIALTAYAGEFDRELALSVGFQQHIPKPVETEILLKAIASLINSSPAKDLS
ncbi:PAS domain-containing protein [Nostoc sp. FACHB-110]|uniref:hybrid sensor histidine kinase/response regulator n=1 Tax=Nostoc sp. FACHB-110 TaxID=2692834 RepID=UPI0037CB49A2